MFLPSRIVRNGLRDILNYTKLVIAQVFLQSLTHKKHIVIIVLSQNNAHQLIRFPQQAV